MRPGGLDDAAHSSRLIGLVVRSDLGELQHRRTVAVFARAGKLAALIPPKGRNLIRFHGVLAAAAKLVAVGSKLLREVQTCVAGALGVVLVREGRAEERHDSVAGELVDGAVEAVNALRQ